MDERPSLWPHASRKFTLQRTRSCSSYSSPRDASAQLVGCLIWPRYMCTTLCHPPYLHCTALPYIARIARKKLRLSAPKSRCSRSSFACADPLLPHIERELLARRRPESICHRPKGLHGTDLRMDGFQRTPHVLLDLAIWQLSSRICFVSAASSRPEAFAASLSDPLRGSHPAPALPPSRLRSARRATHVHRVLLTMQR